MSERLEAFYHTAWLMLKARKPGLNKQMTNIELEIAFGLPGWKTEGKAEIPTNDKLEIL